jgi:hypothetical protein
VKPDRVDLAGKSGGILLGLVVLIGRGRLTTGLRGVHIWPVRPASGQDGALVGPCVVSRAVEAAGVRLAVLAVQGYAQEQAG